MRDSNRSRHGIIFTAGLVFMMVLLSTTIGCTNKPVVSALLSVRPPHVSPGASTPPAEIMERMIAAHAVTVKCRRTLKTALKKPEVLATQWYRKNPDDALSRLENALKTKVLPDTNLIRISIRTKNAHDSVAIVNAVAEAYVVDMIEMSRKPNLEIIKTLEREQRDLQKKLDHIRKDKARIKSVVTMSDFRAEVAKLGELSRRLTQLALVKVQVAKNHESLVKLAKSGDLAKSPEVVKCLDSDGRLCALQQSEVSLLVERDNALRQFGPAHRMVKTIESRLASLKKAIAKREKVLITFQIKSMFEFMEAQTAALTAQQLQIQKEYDKTSSSIKDAEVVIVNLKQLDRRETALNKALQRLRSRLIELRIAIKAKQPEVFIQVRAEVPEK